MDPGIICYQHCIKKHYCVNLPERCTECAKDLKNAEFKILPFRVPYPFIRASQYPCSVIMKPTTGDFLNDYENSTNLHIGVTTSSGLIVEFDERGLRRHNGSTWSQCLKLEQMPDCWAEHWDTTLLDISKLPIWLPSNYDDQKHNCYTFVLTFLQKLGYVGISKAADDKTAFCEQFIIPCTTAAGKYISLYRKLKSGVGFL